MPPTHRQRAVQAFNAYILPAGWALFLTGMFWAWDRTLYHKLFYLFVAAPTLIALVLQPKHCKTLVCNPLFAAFALFSAYMMLTLNWTEGGDDFGSLIKRPLYVAMLLGAAGLIALNRPETLMRSTWTAGLVAALAAGVSVLYFYAVDFSPLIPRLTGYGALYNPLLTAHVLGAFASFWLATWFLSNKWWAPVPLVCLAILGVALLATGSRTPLVGLSAVMLWLTLVGDKKRAVAIIAALTLAALAIALIAPEVFTQRGVSYRPSIWMNALEQISARPWLGYGYDYPMVIALPERAGPALADPHNIELGVLYAGGIVGLTLWMLLYGLAAYFCWKNRHEPSVVICASWLIFGFFSGLTEGNAFMPRPKEHWFLIWIPLSLIYAQWLGKWQGWALKRPA